MNRLTALRPRRSLTLPTLMIAVPVLYFGYRGAAMGCPAGPGSRCLDAAHAGYALAGLLGAYLAACGALAVVDADALVAVHPYARLALRPTDRTLAVLAAFVVGGAGYLLATLVTAIPPWLDAVLAPVGVVLGLPFAVSYATMVIVADAASSEPSVPFQSAIVAVSLALTSVWLFALATGVAGLLDSWIPAETWSQ